jgi:hypothetical protein
MSLMVSEKLAMPADKLRTCDVPLQPELLLLQLFVLGIPCSSAASN